MERRLGLGPHRQRRGSYTGEFDGNNNTIDNLFIDRDGATETGNYAGLFAYIQGPFKNLGVTNVDITLGGSTARSDDVHVGGLAGFSSNGTVAGSWTTGSVKAKTFNFSASDKVVYVGGLLGKLEGGSAEVAGSYSWADVEGEVDDSDSATMRVRAGGLVGATALTAEIVASFARGAVKATAKGTNSSEAEAGGLVGSLGGPLTSSYAAGAVTATAESTTNTATAATARAGGLVGHQSTTTSDINDAFSTGAAAATGTCTDNSNLGCTATSSQGGLVGARSAGNTTNSYWDSSTSGITATGQGTAKTTSELRTPGGNHLLGHLRQLEP